MKTIVENMILKYKSKIGKADTRRISSRTIIPIEVIKILNLDFGDEIIWTVDIEGKGATVMVTKKEENEPMAAK
jgi:hypothetical protein